VISINQIVISGRVVSTLFGETSSEIPACSFVVKVNSSSGQSVFVRVNVYNKFAERCVTNVKKGLYVIVAGELMQRKINDKDIVVIEIRAKNIIFVNEDLVKIKDEAKEEVKNESGQDESK